MSKWTTKQMPNQTGRRVVVTGANTGIGYETALALAAKGASVVMGCRSEEKGREALERLRAAESKAEVSLSVLDLASLESVHDFAKRRLAESDRFDLLVNNAGVMMPPPSKTADGFELQFGTNHLGHFALTGLLLQRLLETTDSRVVTVSSVAHKYGEIAFDDLQWERREYKPMASYGQSKLANLLFTYELQRRLHKAGATTLSLAAHPGWTGTDLQRHSGLFRALNPLLAMKPWQGALPTLFAATAEGVEEGEYFGPGGLMEMRGYPKRVGSNPASRNEDTARRLWEVSEELTGVRFGL